MCGVPGVRMRPNDAATPTLRRPVNLEQDRAEGQVHETMGNVEARSAAATALQLILREKNLKQP